jgi:isochorismate synthase
MHATEITPLLEKASELARARRAPVLASLSRRIDRLDPLAVVENIVRSSASDEAIASQFAAGCAYWSRPSDGFSFAGVGAVATFEPSGAGRFKSVDHAWASLLDSALIEDPDGTGRGPLLVGGFAFDPDGPQSEQWRDFPSAHLIVPRVLLVADDGDHTLTITVLVGADGRPDADAEAIAGLVDAMLSVPLHDIGNETADEEGTLRYSEPASQSRWEGMVHLALDKIRAGELEKVVLARGLQASASRSIDVLAVLNHLRSRHVDSFVFGYWRGESVFIGASPERLVSFEGRQIFASSLAGTITRGANPAEDVSNAEALLGSEKDQAEHAAVRRALYEKLAEQCDDVIAPEEPSLLTLPHVHHLHTPFRARLRDSASLLSLAGRLHPTPAVGGSPRDAALRFIDEHEDIDRGWYASPIGWIGRDSGEFAVALRSALINGDDALLFAGCGLVAGSDPALEYAESSLKMRSMQSALEAAMASESSERATI